MSAIVGQDWRPKTLRELFIQWQAICLESWHHTASIRSSFLDMRKIKYENLHPYFSAGKSSNSATIEAKPLFQTD